MKRTLRHPFGGPRRMLRPERDRRVKRKAPHQPRIHQGKRLSVGAVLDAPDSRAARPSLRLRIVGLCVIVLFALLGLRLWTLQVIQAPAAAKAVSANQVRAVAITPVRGEILAASGHPLADNVTVQQIDLSRTAAQQHPGVVGQLAALTGQTTAQIHHALNSNQYSPYEPVPVLSQAPAAEVLYIAEHKDLFPGVTTPSATQRNYPQVETGGSATQGEYPASQVLGYVSSISASELKAEAGKGYQQGDLFGQSGLEAQYQSFLRGTPGTQDLEVDASGDTVGTLKTTPAKAGDNVVTNIDLGLQQAADNALASQIQTDRRTWDPYCNHNAGCYAPATDGAVVVLGPQGGQVLAMSSYPSYNPDVWVGGISTANYQALSTSHALINYAIDGLYTPGSTFKLNTATAALNTGLIGPSYIYVDNNTFTVTPCQGTQCTFHNDENDHGFGPITITKAITVSSDDFFYNLGDMFYNQRGTYGQTPIQNAANQYSLGELTGIDLPGETAGWVDSQAVREKLHKQAPAAFPNTTWYAGDNVEMAFGQGSTVITPIEQAVAYATFANGGTRYAPQVAAAIVSPSGKVVKRFAPQVTGHVPISPANRAAMLSGFEGVIQQSDGTGYQAFQGNAFPTNELAGKTGTASTNNKEPTSWFVAWGPVANPQYVVASVIDQGGYGASASAPVVASIFNYLASHPVQAPVIPPSQSTAQDNTPVTTTTTTTTTTTPGSSSTGSSAPSSTTTTAPAHGSTTTTAPAHGSTTTTKAG